MVRRAVHQFHQGIRRGDAIGEEMLALREILQENGYDSEIFLEQTPAVPELGERSLSAYRGDPANLLLVHHSIGHDSAGLVAALPDREILVYHNITPSRFFAASPSFSEFLERGNRQLLFYRDRVEGAFADSQFNARDLWRLGFERVEVLPPVFGLSRLTPAASPASTERLAEPFVLFVGRFAANKRQEDVVEVFDRFSRYQHGAGLVFVGEADATDPYARRVLERIARSPSRERIRVAGLLSEEELAELYRGAAVYLSMSEHEGFGRPLLEAFAHGLPVLAYDASAVAETMGGAGILFSQKNMDEVAAMMSALVSDPQLRARVVRDQYRRLEQPDIARARDRFLEAIDRVMIRPEIRRGEDALEEAASLRIEGPFDTSYGLAVANRALAEALDEHGPYDVSIHSMDGPGDYLPRSEDLAGKPRARQLWEKSFLRSRPDVVVRNTYPPRFDRLAGKLNLSYFFWEDSLLPEGWAEDFNAHFDGVLAPSEHVRRVLRDSGVTRPIEIVPVPLHLEDSEADIPPAELPTKKRTRFLSVGSGFPRKGVDVLLRAFVRAFTEEDDVVLVLKTFPNIRNKTAELIARLRAENPGCPEILHIDRDLTRRELLGLYRGADAFVSPARAEGFGLPVAEAMLLGLPVITTAATGLADFCNKETALIVPHHMVPSESHLGVPGARWAEPDEDVLVELLRGFAGGVLRSEAARRAANARRLIEEEFSARAVARRTELATTRLFRDKLRKRAVGYLSTWNCRCGIGQYTEKLVRALPNDSVDITILASADSARLAPDGPEVARVWNQFSPDYSRVLNAALEHRLKTVHVQFHPSLFPDYEQFASLLHALRDREIRVIITLHLLEAAFFGDRMQEPEVLAPALGRCEVLVAHNPNEIERLDAFGLATRAIQIPHGGVVFRPRDRKSIARELGLEGRRVFASFGFAFPHKGILESIEAVKILKEIFPDILFLALASGRPEQASVEYLASCRRRIGELGLGNEVMLIDEFLRESDLELLLSAAEVAVLPYRETKESASGAVRYPLAAGRATITTTARIFSDVRDVVLQIPEARPETIAQAVARLLRDAELRGRLERDAREFASRHSWEAVARLHLSLYGAAGEGAPHVQPEA